MPVVLSDPATASSTATEAKTMALTAGDVRKPLADLASGTSSDSVVVAGTMRGAGLSYAGPATTVGRLVACTARPSRGHAARRWDGTGAGASAGEPLGAGASGFAVEHLVDPSGAGDG